MKNRLPLVVAAAVLLAAAFGAGMYVNSAPYQIKFARNALFIFDPNTGRLCLSDVADMAVAGTDKCGASFRELWSAELARREALEAKSP